MYIIFKYKQLIVLSKMKSPYQTAKVVKSRLIFLEVHVSYSIRVCNYLYTIKITIFHLGRGLYFRIGGVVKTNR